ncbi:MULTISPECIES: bifunctional heptose 7-phosphate kinase/heptose 1-phosphate adenyltransferase [Halanaerobium]|jgi:rfaE bifunctional protein kinase chain/domain|uniref:RfaE bifunctional protein kinase chain/domain n=2 Tax=Halanaerobium TaxID=2330 RepID=A0A4R6S0H1_9FIRM|nr:MULTISPECIES: PfkB family carbohydrate kinase [Halanaerobium]KXS48196.1 MAG: PfkB domain-containing protein [Halanaerobium sp. T82-1]PUU90764.1 MAG: PfkB domain-containing protein [Halanaerobium sp.]PUU95516.1 MAG: PfkB domain-containing protein [Halanaerobium sp.]TDP92733.1 rfaE bifunctional protein kinase chain/domain [Halanaerobium saccharolyticum]SIR34096.1 rfaE bifunctional protein, domain I [Halanaerobium kushneri]
MGNYSSEELIKYINKFSEKRIMVLGDLIADKFIIADPERLSREAPVLILKHQQEKILPGGGANAAANIASLGAEVDLLGVVGEDLAAEALIEELEERQILTAGVFKDRSRPTAEKTRILAGGEQIVRQQVVRVDKVKSFDISTQLQQKLNSYLKENIASSDAILFSDYGNGIFNQNSTAQFVEAAAAAGKESAVDSRYQLNQFKGAVIATPNLEEASAIYGRELRSQAEVEKAGLEMRKKLELKYLLITQGGDGMTLFAPGDKIEHIAAANFSEVFDVTGAGDTVVGTLVLALAAGAPAEIAIRIANYAAGIVVRKSGVASVTGAELIREVNKNDS